ncbi:hypothetical protein EDD16DRAFT_1018997 [Pisolithus croceorrhizus]|nr:hypothetical protein EDD16DRAFT_1018997 [Pisolithus croceorrhizus]
MTSGKQAVAQSHPAPYLPQNTTHHTRHTPPSSDSASTHTRRQRPRKQREDRYEEEIQFNIAFFGSARGQRDPVQPPRMLDEEYPPPPAYEKATSATVSTIVSEDYVHEGGSSISVDGVIPAPPTPVIGTRQQADRSDSDSVTTVPPTPQTEEDGSSIELVDLEPSARWELERQRGVPLEERAKRHKQRMGSAVTPTTAPQRARLFSQPTTRRPTAMQFHASQLSLQIPEDHDRYDDERVQDNSDVSTPPTPKNPKLPHLPVSPSKFFHLRSQSPQPSSSVISLLRNPSPFFKSTPSLLSLPPSHHGNQRSRKLFHRKSKEHSSNEQLGDWEVLERSDSNESMVQTSPSTLQNSASQQFPPTSGGGNRRNRHRYRSNDRAQKTSTIQMPDTSNSNDHTPGSPPFVSRHLRRHTNSNRSGQMSAPVSPISVSSASTFDSAATTLPQSASVADSEEAFPDLEYHSEPRSTPRHGTQVKRGYDRTPRMSSPEPPSGAMMYEYDPELPIASCGSGALPARAATERVVRQPESREAQRGRSLSREMCMRSAPAYSMLFPSGPPFPLPGAQTPPQEVQTLPPPPPCKCPSTASCPSSGGCTPILTSSPLASATYAPSVSTCPPGFPCPQPLKCSPSRARASASVSSSPQTPRKHYPGRPLPATPPVSPSLTWILDGQPHVQLHPRAANASLAHGQISPWVRAPMVLPEKMGTPRPSHTPPLPDPAPRYAQLPEKAPRTPPMPEGTSDAPTAVATPCTPPMPGAFSRTPPIPESTFHTPSMPSSLLNTPPVPEGLLIDFSDDDHSPDKQTQSPSDAPTSPDLLDLLESPLPSPKCPDLLDFSEPEESSQGAGSISLGEILSDGNASPSTPNTLAPLRFDLMEDDAYPYDKEQRNSGEENDSASDGDTVSPGPLTPSTLNGFVSASGSVVSLVPVQVSTEHAEEDHVKGGNSEVDMPASAPAPNPDAKDYYPGPPRLGTPRQRPSPTAC